VRDKGIGIGREMLPCVFELFTQVERSLDRSQGGLGIELSLVRQLVEMHGGTVGVHSDGPGSGSEFVICLPVMVPALAPGERAGLVLPGRAIDAPADADRRPPVPHDF
jgi:signal transduction histidine kinase